MALRWGIVSAGRISHDFACALSTLPASDHKAVAVGARTLDSAQKFADLHGIPQAYEGYEALAKDPNIDVIYIGSVNTTHLEIGLMMLEHGKHILCEKPLCMNEKQAVKLLEKAKAKKLFCMEAVWSRYFPAYQYIKQIIEDGELGDIVEVTANFGFDHTHSERVQVKAVGGGTIIDMGVYTIQSVLWAFRDVPLEISATGTLNADGVDTSIDATLKFKNGVARMTTYSLGTLDNLWTIRGTKGTITVPLFWCPTTIVNHKGETKSWPLPKSKIPTTYPNSEGLRYEAEETRRCIKAGLLESPDMKHEESLKIAKIQDKLRALVGVKYPEDDE